ncbi:MAG: sugar porter family MFS transporter [Bacteroidia bacterium]
MNKSLVWSISVALAGLLFGFDTAVISGVNEELQELWKSSDLFHGFVVVGMALWGTVVGALLGRIPTNKYGRKNTLIGIGVLFFVSAIGSALANDPYMFAFFRFLGGLGVGASTIAAPAYISEIAPANKRGRLVALYQLSIVVGILMALLSNYLLRDVGVNAWKWMIGVEAVPALIYGIIILYVPKSPRWLLLNGKLEEASRVLQSVNPEVDVQALVQEVDKESASGMETIFMKKYRAPLMLIFFIAFFNQFSGINAIMYYAPTIFREAGLERSSALFSTVGIGIVNVVFTLIGMSMIDRLGRKQLMYIGSAGYIISLSLVAISFMLAWGGLPVAIFLFLFIASHAVGQGAVIWVFIAELFPTHLRASGQAFGSSVHWILAAAIPSLIPVLFSTIGAGVVFAIFALMMVGQLFWVHFKMPETKGVSLEELSKRFVQ